jgi:hypothetical protein
VEDFKQWRNWSPWNIIEPECEMELTGTTGEVGSSMSWNSPLEVKPHELKTSVFFPLRD